MISLISSFEIINVVLHKVKSKGSPASSTFLWIPATVADATTVNHNGIKTLLPNGLRTFNAKKNSVLSNGPKRLPKSSFYLMQ